MIVSLSWLYFLAALIALVFIAALGLRFWVRGRADRSWRGLVVEVLSRIYPAAIEEVLRRHGAMAPAWRAESIAAQITTQLESCGPDNPPLLVYQMSKVGSATVAASLEAARPKNPIFHVHFMAPDHLDRIERDYATMAPGKELPGNYVVGRELGRQIKSRGLKSLIITLVRDPIGRAISSLFQAPEWAYIPVLDARGEISVDLCVKSIQEEARLPGAFAYPEQWFDNELRAFFGIDVFAQPFDTQKGYQILESDGHRLLILRMEGMNRILASAMTEFLELNRELSVQSANVRSDTPEARAYDELKRRVALSPDWLREFYRGRYASHFYTQQMIDKFIVKWSDTSR